MYIESGFSYILYVFSESGPLSYGRHYLGIGKVGFTYSLGALYPVIKVPHHELFRPDFHFSDRRKWSEMVGNGRKRSEIEKSAKSIPNLILILHPRNDSLAAILMKSFPQTG